jgi:predicted ATPase/class 3 adenylate cyclase
LTPVPRWGSIGRVEPPSPPASPGRGPRSATPRTLPAGTVTFLFTDIEGSTALITRLGSAYEELLEVHRGILRAAFEAAGGVEVQTEGDAFFVVFASAGAAAAACIAAQRGLSTYPWPTDSPVRVRMGLHTGEATPTMDGDYTSLEVHRAARIAAAGHGGQVLVSETTRTLLEGRLPADVTIRDLGEHRLKDLRPERLSQLEAAGLPVDFPPIRSLDRRPNNLPTQLTSFVGRDRDLAATQLLLDASRLLTLTGPGGIGKTRLALQLAAAAADGYPDGVWFVPLEPLREAELVPGAIAHVVGLADSGVRPAAELLVEHLAARTCLLVLDNFEQVIAAAPLVAQLLRACPDLTVVATSRGALHVSGEQEYAVPGLPTPPDSRHLSTLEVAQLPADVRAGDPATLGQYEAVRLFVARAVAVRADFRVTNENAPAVAGICAALQGLPLAIELAAARVKVLTPDAILDRLEHRLELLASASRDLPERQRTLRGAIAWSYDLLDDAGRRLLARLSVFVGGCDLPMIERVCDPDGELGIDLLDVLVALVDQSLVRSDDVAGVPRFALLDTIRTYGAERLDSSGEGAVVRARHLAAYLELAERAASELSGPSQRTWLDRLEADADNLRAALDRAEAIPDPEAAARLGFALWRFWQQRGYLREARRRLTALEAHGWDLAPKTHARLLEALAGVAYWQADFEASRPWYQAALEIWRTLGDRREIANGLYNLGSSNIPALRRGGDSRDTETWRRARTDLDEALENYEAIGDRLGQGNVLWGIGGLYYFASEVAEAEGWYVRSLEHFRAAGNRTMEAWALHMLGSAVLKQGRTDSAADMLRHALRHFHEAGDLSGITMVVDDLSAVAVTEGDLPRAARLRGAARQLTQSTGTELAGIVEEVFEQATRPNARVAMDAAERERLEAQGGGLALDTAVAYALGEADPFAPGAGQGAP